MKKRFTAGVLLAIFTFLFLETEYLFVNIMGTLSNSRQAVSAQGIVLGVSVIGFLLYALFHRIKSAFVKRVVTVVVPLVMAVCLSLLYEADSYARNTSVNKIKKNNPINNRWFLNCISHVNFDFLRINKPATNTRTLAIRATG